MTIDEILKCIRLELGISQETLARELDVSHTTLNRWETKKAYPSRLAIKQLKNFCTQNKVSGEIAEALAAQTRFTRGGTDND